MTRPGHNRPTVRQCVILFVLVLASVLLIGGLL